MTDKDKRTEINRRGQAKRTERSNVIAQGLGFPTWTKLLTAAINNEIKITVEWVENKLD